MRTTVNGIPMVQGPDGLYRREMTHVIITPCLLGFDVKTKAHRDSNGYTRSHGIFTASDLFEQLKRTSECTIELR